MQIKIIYIFFKIALTKVSNAYIRSSHGRCSINKGNLRNFVKFTGKHLCQSLFLKKVAGLKPASLLIMRLWHKCFPVSFAKFLRTPFYRIPLGDCFWYIYKQICTNNILHLLQSNTEQKILGFQNTRLILSWINFL